MGKKVRVLFCRVLLVLLTAVLIVFITFPVMKVMNSSCPVIIKDKEMNYYRGDKLFICGDIIICSRDSEYTKDRSTLPEEDRSRHSFKILSMKDIVVIEILHDEEISTSAVLPVNSQYLGRYNIKLQGHDGILVIGVSKERIYATIRFPKWGKGAVEYLKGIRIASGDVKFIRSASTPEEIKRLGANYLFKQKFSGTYSSSGKIIKGFMVNDRGEKHEWEAFRK